MRARLHCGDCRGVGEVQTGRDYTGYPITARCITCSGQGDVDQDCTPQQLVESLVTQVRLEIRDADDALVILAGHGLTAAPATLDDAIEAAVRRDDLADRTLDPWSLIDDDEVSWWRARGVDALRDELADRADSDYQDAVRQLARHALAPVGAA